MSEPTTAELLANARKAYNRALNAVEVGHGDRKLKHQTLTDLRAAIKDLEAKLSAEQASAAGSFGPRFLLADMSRDLRGSHD